MAAGDAHNCPVGPSGISPAMARQKLLGARETVAPSKSPAHEKQREQHRVTVVLVICRVQVARIYPAGQAGDSNLERDHASLPAFTNGEQYKLLSCIGKIHVACFSTPQGELCRSHLAENQIFDE